MDTLYDMVEMVCMMGLILSLSHPFLLQWSHSTATRQSCKPKVSLFVFLSSTWKRQRPVTCNSTACFTFLPLSALTCPSCDGTQTFFRNRWYSGGLGEPDHLISYLLLLHLKHSPPVFTLPLCSTQCLHLYHRPSHSFNLWPYMELGILFKWTSLAKPELTRLDQQSQSDWKNS